jgi:hypothetical protein
MILTKSTLADPTGRVLKEQKVGYISDYYLKKNTVNSDNQRHQRQADGFYANPDKQGIKSGAYQLQQQAEFNASSEDVYGTNKSQLH